MAEIGDLINLQDISRQLGPDGNVSKAISILATENQILDDIPWMEGNQTTGHLSTIETGYPEPSWRILNYGVAQQKGVTAQIVDTCARMENYLEVDTAIADLNNYKSSFVENQMKSFIKGYGTKMATTLFYGDTSTTPEGFKGLTPRFTTISTDEDESGYNIIDAGGTDSVNTSIWFVVWKSDTAFGIYPQGTEAGFKWKDLGEQTKEDANGLMHQVYRYNASWNCGFAVPNWRGIVRIANIDMTKLRTADDTTDTSANLVKYMNLAVDKVEDFIDGGTAVFYMNQEVRSYLRIKIDEKGFAQIRSEEVMGRKNVLTFAGYPVRGCRALLKTEDQVS